MTADSGRPVHRPQPRWASVTKTWSPFLLAVCPALSNLCLFSFHQPGPLCLVALPCLPSFLGWTVGTCRSGSTSNSPVHPRSPRLSWGYWWQNAFLPEVKREALMAQKNSPRWSAHHASRWTCFTLVISREGTSLTKTTQVIKGVEPGIQTRVL